MAIIRTYIEKPISNLAISDQGNGLGGFRRVSTKNYVKDNIMFSCFPFTNVQLVPIKTLQSLHVKFRAINESFEINLDYTMITRG